MWSFGPTAAATGACFLGILIVIVVFVSFIMVHMVMCGNYGIRWIARRVA
jgi:hypothetical protein